MDKKQFFALCAMSHLRFHVSLPVVLCLLLLPTSRGFEGFTDALLSEVQWFLVFWPAASLTAPFQVPALSTPSWRQTPGLPGTWYKARVGGVIGLLFSQNAN